MRPKKQPLTDNDIKTIKYELRFAWMFGIALIAILLFADLYYLTMNEEINAKYLFYANSLMGLMAFMIAYLGNLKYYTDIKNGIKNVYTYEIEKKESEISYEAGSGKLAVPVLGTIIPKKFSMQPKSNTVYFITANGQRYRVEKDQFDNAIPGNLVEIHISEYTETMLGVRIVE